MNPDEVPDVTTLVTKPLISSKSPNPPSGVELMGVKVMTGVMLEVTCPLLSTIIDFRKLKSACKPITPPSVTTRGGLMLKVGEVDGKVGPMNLMGGVRVGS